MPLHLRARRERRSAEHINGPTFRQLDTSVSPQDVSGKVELTLIAGNAIEFNQSHLNFGMTRNNGLLRRWTVIHNEEIVHEANAGIEQTAIACRPIVSNRTLQHVSNVVQLMARRLRRWKHSQRFPVILIIGVQIATGLLDRNHLVDDFVSGRPKLWTIS